MKVKSIIVAITLTLSVSTFSSDNMNHSNMDHSKKKTKTNRKQLDAKTKTSLINVLKANEGLHSSFFSYDGKKVEDNAKNLSSAIGNISNTEISKLLAFSQKKLGEIKASKDRKENDKNYNIVSMALIHIVNKYDIGSEYNAYSCPMVKKKWVQNSKKMAKVHNPYAPEMPHCGSQDSSH